MEPVYSIYYGIHRIERSSNNNTSEFNCSSNKAIQIQFFFKPVYLFCGYLFFTQSGMFRWFKIEVKNMRFGNKQLSLLINLKSLWFQFGKKVKALILLPGIPLKAQMSLLKGPISQPPM